jgi:hypothetical protein
MFADKNAGCLKKSCLVIKHGNYLKKLVEYAKSKCEKVYFMFGDYDFNDDAKALVKKFKVEVLKDTGKYELSKTETDMFVINPKNPDKQGFVVQKAAQKKNSARPVTESSAEGFETPYEEEKRKLPERIAGRRKKIDKVVIQEVFWKDDLVKKYKPDQKEVLCQTITDTLRSLGNGIDATMMAWRFAQHLGIPFKHAEGELAPGGSFEITNKMVKELEKKSVIQLRELLDVLGTIKSFVKKTDWHGFNYFPEYLPFAEEGRKRFDTEYGEKIKAEQVRLADLKRKDKLLSDHIVNANKKNNRTGVLTSAFPNGKLVPIKDFKIELEMKAFGYSDPAQLYFAIQSKLKNETRKAVPEKV